MSFMNVDRVYNFISNYEHPSPTDHPGHSLGRIVFA